MAVWRGFKVYRSFVFDCDGVLLDSNQIKTKAFYDIALPYGRTVAMAFVKYHKNHLGISRFSKINYLIESLVGRSPKEGEYESLVEKYGALVFDKLKNSEETFGLRAALAQLPPNVMSYVVSAGAETEVREVLEHKQLTNFFSAVYGSPATKDIVLHRLTEVGALPLPGVFFGDSRQDYEVAQRFGLDFVFLSKHTEFADWRQFFRGREVTVVETFGDLMTIEKQGVPF